jgi:hypothetical protein
MSYMTINEIADTVGVKNRFEGTEVVIVHDGLPVTWAPGETRFLPRTYADFFLRHSVLKTTNTGQAKVRALCILGLGQDESPLDAAPYEGPRELIERDPDAPTMFDAEGRPLHAVLVKVTGVAGAQQEAAAVTNAEAKANDARAKEGRAETTEQIANVLAAAPDEVVEQLGAAAQEIAAGKHGGGAKFHGLKGNDTVA